MFDGQPKQLLIYETKDGTQPLEKWMTKLRDVEAIARFDERIDRLERGNPGDYKSVGAGVYELRIDYGRASDSILPLRDGKSFCCFAAVIKQPRRAIFDWHNNTGKNTSNDKRHDEMG